MVQRVPHALEATNVRIDGPGTIDGADCTRPQGEEGFRGPHAIVLRNCRGIHICDMTIRRTGNYALMCFDCRARQPSPPHLRGRGPCRKRLECGIGPEAITKC